MRSRERCIQWRLRRPNLSDMHLLPDLLHSEERKVWGDGGYQGQTKSRPTSRAARPGHDLPQDEVQQLCGRSRQKEGWNYCRFRARQQIATSKRKTPILICFMALPGAFRHSPVAMPTVLATRTALLMNIAKPREVPIWPSFLAPDP